MNRGRKPKPAHLRLLQGNPGNRPINDAIKPTPILPEPSPFLSRDAREEFMRLREELHNCGLLTVVDVRQFEAYCTAYGRWVAAERALAQLGKRKTSRAGGLMIVTKGGNQIQTPLVGTANKAMKDMVAYASEFGLTPSSRTRISAGILPKESKFGGLIG